MSEHPERAATPAEAAEGELSLARIALAEQDFRHTATHLGNAIGCDPSHLPGYALIGELVDAVGGAGAAAELFPLDRSAHVGTAAVRADLYARAGEIRHAVGLLASITASAPEFPWAAAPWFAPDLAEVLPDRDVAEVAGKFIGDLGDPVPEELRAPLAPWLDLVRAMVARPGTDPSMVTVMSGFARRLGAVDEAIGWCRTVAEQEAMAGAPTPIPLIMLGYAYRAAHQPEETAAVWQRALALDPGNLELLIDLAELAIGAGDFDGALRWARQAAALDPEHVKPIAVDLYARYRRTVTDERVGDIGPLIDLADLARTQPDQPYPRVLLRSACARVHWLNVVPAGTEGSESPSVATVPSASPIAAEKLYQTVQGYWRDPLDAYDRSVGLAGLDEAELLGLLAHVPPAPDHDPWPGLPDSSPAYWQRLAQAWTCVGILHLRTEQQWETSVRRGLLLRLLNGPEDGTVDAAAFALCVSAWVFPRQRADVAEAITRRYLVAARAVGERPAELRDPLAEVLLACPAVELRASRLARDFRTLD
ncbi:MAG TPA: tetratricopeptide repeat protein [Pseudonocardiaceae bacterium]|nr:tetratricopeptide repeat protein [Pseudonocardiaceae bacterium]